PGSRAGVVFGSVFFAVLQNGSVIQKGLNHVHGALSPIPGLGHVLYGPTQQYVPDVIGGILLLQTIVFNPHELATMLDPFVRWLRGGRFDVHADETGPAAVEGSSVRA